MATLLFLGASVSQVPAIRHARRDGHRVVAFDGNPDAIGFPLCDVAEPIDFTDIDRVAEAAQRLGVDGILAVATDRAVAPAATAAEWLELPGVGIEVARRMTDKAAMRARLRQARVPQPVHAVVRDRADLLAAAHGVPFPAVLKPTDSGGQRGLFLVKNIADAQRRLPETLSSSPSATAMLEQYTEGVELNGLLVVRDGQPTLFTLSDRHRPHGPGFGVGWIHSFPSSLSQPVLARAREVAFAAVEALGLRDGIAFPQLIADSHGNVQIIEVAARIAAGQMADLVRLGTGIDLVEIAIAQALGRPVADRLVAARFTRPIAIRFFTSRPGILPIGTVTAINGLEQVRASPGVLAADLYIGVGSTIRPLQVDADRNGYVIATASTPAHALALADRAAATLIVQTVPAAQRAVTVTSSAAP